MPWNSPLIQAKRSRGVEAEVSEIKGNGYDYAFAASQSHTGTTTKKK